MRNAFSLQYEHVKPCVCSALITIHINSHKVGQSLLQTLIRALAIVFSSSHLKLVTVHYNKNGLIHIDPHNVCIHTPILHGAGYYLRSL